jgi:hypothetical protein
MINRTNAFAGVLMAGLLGLGLYQGYMRNAPPPAPSNGEPLVKIQLPDIDADKQPDMLYITAPTNGQSAVMLTHTVKNRTGEMMPLPVDGPLTVEGQAPSWIVKDAAGKTKLTVRTYQVDPKVPPDLIVASDTAAKRYFWMQRGFVKLDALTVTPGFAVGLVLVDDPKAAVETIAGSPDAQGFWKQPIADAPPVHLSFDKKDRVSEISYESPRFSCDFSLAPGKPLSEQAKQLPAKTEGDRWVASTYGLIGTMDASRVLTKLAIVRPWVDEPPTKKAPPKKK